VSKRTTKIYVIPEGFSLDFERYGIQEVPLEATDFAMVLLEKSEMLDLPEVQEQIKRALAAGKVLALPLGSCDSQAIQKPAP